MTKEEYERLLKSDYWKGYSYSLIKERNFTCEDCGRSFPNERNKLQVHHLVYRDINPWSYKPEEVIVLCKECHQKRHGIIPNTEPINVSKNYETDNYTRSYSADYNTSEKDVRQEGLPKRPDYFPENRRIMGKFVAISCLIATIMFFIIPRDKDSANEESSQEAAKTEVSTNKEANRNTAPVVAKKQTQTNKRESAQQSIVQEDAVTDVSTESQVKGTVKDEEVDNLTSPSQLSSTEPSEQRSTAEVLDEMIHASVVKQAKEAGVSTEGTTSEILDRINHASVVKQAKQAGVSTEGSTSEILDRINHASVVKQAKEAGVSTEGTTSEILDRIIKKNLEKNAQ